MRVKCLAQEHKTMTRPGLEPGPLDPESSALTTRPLRLPSYEVAGIKEKKSKKSKKSRRTGLQITAGQRTMSGQNWVLTGQIL